MWLRGKRLKTELGTLLEGGTSCLRLTVFLELATCPLPAKIIMRAIFIISSSPLHLKINMRIVLLIQSVQVCRT